MRERDVIRYSESMFPSEDAAHFKMGKGYVIMTTDMLVAKTDVPSGMTMRQIGRKVVAQNLSDIAAMGSSPHYFCASMSFPKDFFLKDAKEIIDGINAECRRYEVKFVGGDTNEGNLSIAGFAMGFSSRVILRRGAKAGDYVCLTGDVGRVGAGFLDLEKATKAMRKKIFEPQPRVKEGKILYANACIDISDGLSKELHTITECSGVRIDIESEMIPIHRDIFKTAQRHLKETIELALSSGEEYELLFTCTKRQMEKNDFDFSIMGSVGKGKGVFLDGKRMKREGWEHFR